MPPRIRRRITNAKREEIERQQDSLSKTIVRPFENLAGLPVSFNPPPNGHYEDVFKYPLTIKDSGVFYRSLMKSRMNYIFTCPMFKLYWMKQSSYAKKLAEHDKGTSKSTKEETQERKPVLPFDVSARDVMVKLCDASLDLGPHRFEIRLFIAKDERSDKQKKGDPETKSGPEESNVVKGPNELGLVKEPLKSGSMSGPSNSEFSEESALTTEPAKESTTSEPLSGPLSSEGSVDEPAKSSETQKPKEEENEETNDETNIAMESVPSQDDNSNDVSKSSSREPSNVHSHSEEPTEVENENSSEKQKAMVDNNVPSSLQEKSKTPSETGAPHENSAAEVKAPPGVITSAPVSSIPSEPSVTPVGTPPAPAGHASGQEGSSAQSPKSQAANMQSIENTIMISNLNLIARTDLSLNALMKVVASGNASPQKIIEFQGYIKRAREMGPQPHHAYLFGQNIPGKKKERKPRERKLPKEKVSKDQKLTAFQEKYTKDATLLFEFVENANNRFLLPKDAICEVLPSSNTDSTLSDDERADFRDILVSFIWIHNTNDLDIYHRRLEEYESYVVKKEKEAAEAEAEAARANEKEKQNEDITKEKEEGEGTTQQNEGEQGDIPKKEETKDASTSKSVPLRNLRKKKKGNFGRKKPTQKKPPERPEEPELRYTTLSFKLVDIPQKYVPIIANSFSPVEQVQEKMTKTLANGMRSHNFYLWYQLDGKLDETLAENIRVQLNQEEKKMQGVSGANIQQSNKRKSKEKQESKSKRPKGTPGRPPKTKLIEGQVSQINGVDVTLSGVNSNSQISTFAPEQKVDSLGKNATEGIKQEATQENDVSTGAPDREIS